MLQTSLRCTACSCLLVLALFLTGCSMVVDESQVPGTYKAQTDWGTSTLVMARDHSFEQTLTFKDGQQARWLKGKWQLSKSSGTPVYTTVSLSPYMTVTHDKQGTPSGMSMLSIYHVPFGINIAADPDYGIAHRK